MRILLAVTFVAVVVTAAPASAQRFPFERSFSVTTPATLDVSTTRGKIEVVVGEPGRIVVSGTSSVRVGWSVPANAAELARNVAEHPPIQQEGNTLRLRPPSDSREREATTVTYTVRVPPVTQVVSVSDSGAIAVAGVGERVTARTQSGAITLQRLGGAAVVTTSSGAVNVDGVRQAFEVQTSSGGITLRELGGSLKATTQSGAVDASLTGEGDVTVDTSSSGVTLRGVNGALSIETQSGRVSAQGSAIRPWRVSTSSGAVTLALPQQSRVTVDASSRSGAVRVTGATVQGQISPRKIAGSIDGGGPLVHVQTSSGAIQIGVGGR